MIGAGAILMAMCMQREIEEKGRMKIKKVNNERKKKQSNNEGMALKKHSWNKTLMEKSSKTNTMCSMGQKHMTTPTKARSLNIFLGLQSRYDAYILSVWLSLFSQLYTLRIFFYCKVGGRFFLLYSFASRLNSNWVVTLVKKRIKILKYLLPHMWKL